ncbi:MAG: ABC transporter permease [Fimbriimonadaceae bacterium]|nr:ABC transporter permease [Fimbriimonadaceae bacterium]
MKNGHHWALIIIVLALSIFPIFLTGTPLPDAARSFWESSIGQPRGWVVTLRELSPLLIGGVAVLIALRAGLFNIGAEGQMLVGACAATAVALQMPNVSGAILAAIAGMVAGALWAYPAGWLKAYRGGHEVISTIMLNQIAVRLTAWFVKSPMKDPNQIADTSPRLAGAAEWVPVASFGRAHLTWAIPIGLLLCWLLWYWLRHRVAGYELQAVGANPRAAKVAGVNVSQITTRAMAASGALSGLAGATIVLADQGRFYENISAGRGFDALGVALLAGGNPLFVIPTSMVFAILNAGTSGMGLEGIPKGLSGLILGGLILIVGSLRTKTGGSDE